MVLGVVSQQKLLLRHAEELRGSLVDYGLDAVVADDQFERLRWGRRRAHHTCTELAP